MCEQYNGWTNRETWATKLHLDNDETLNDMAWEYAREKMAEYDAGQKVNAYELGETLRYWIEEDALTFESVCANRGLWMMLSDIGSLYRVNWKEIAEAYIGDIGAELEKSL